MKAKRELITIIGIILIAACLLMSIPGHAEYCELTNSSNQNLVANQWNTINFNSEIFDDDDMHDNTNSNSRINITSSGIYVFQTMLYFQGAQVLNSVQRGIQIIKNGTEVIGQTSEYPHSGQYVTILSITISAIDNANEGDYYEVKAYDTQTNYIYRGGKWPKFTALLINQSGSGGGEMTTDQFDAIMAFMIIIAGFCGIMGIKHIFFWIRGENG